MTPHPTTVAGAPAAVGGVGPRGQPDRRDVETGSARRMIAASLTGPPASSER
jgi:hypothetical protein